MDKQRRDGVRIYADYVCPFCYLGYVSFDQYRARRDDPLAENWHPYDLRARQRRSDGTLDRSIDSGKDEAYYEQARETVERLAAKYDVEMAQSLVTDVDSYDTQRVALRVAEDHPDRFEDFHRGVFDALWEDGRDIGASDVIEGIATDAGLPEGFVAETLHDDSTAENLEASFDAAMERGITGVPTFVSRQQVARGAVPPDQLGRLVDGT